MTTDKEGLDQKSMNVWKILSDGGCPLELMQCLSYTPSQNKKSSPLLLATSSQWQKHPQHTLFSELTQVSVPAKDGSQWPSTFTHAYIGPALNCPIMPIKDQHRSAHSTRIIRNNKINIRHPNSSTKIHQQ
jgi:hypothetical protein